MAWCRVPQPVDALARKYHRVGYLLGLCGPPAKQHTTLNIQRNARNMISTCNTSRYEHGYYLLLVVAFLPTFLSLFTFGIAWVWSVAVKKHEICGVPHPSN